jgi:hypothetical protein
MQLDSHVSKTPDTRAIMSMQDVQTGGVIITYKTCGQSAYSVAQQCGTARLIAHRHGWQGM